MHLSQAGEAQGKLVHSSSVLGVWCTTTNSAGRPYRTRAHGGVVVEGRGVVCTPMYAAPSHLVYKATDSGDRP
jgi:hypothetical protein